MASSTVIASPHKRLLDRHTQKKLAGIGRVIMILLIMNMGNILNVAFDKVFLMQNSLNLGSGQRQDAGRIELIAATE